MAVFDGKLLKYGPIKGNDHVYMPIVLEASQIFEAASAKFVTVDATTGKAGLTTASDTSIFGWVDCEAYTSADADVRMCLIGIAPVVFRVPVLAADYAGVVQAAIGDMCDLKLTTVGSNTTFQTAVPGTTTRSLLMIVGIDPNATSGVATWVDVVINLTKLGSS